MRRLHTSGFAASDVASIYKTHKFLQLKDVYSFEVYRYNMLQPQ